MYSFILSPCGGIEVTSPIVGSLILGTTMLLGLLGKVVVVC
jgi:hypothetical protein